MSNQTNRGSLQFRRFVSYIYDLSCAELWNMEAVLAVVFSVMNFSISSLYDVLFFRDWTFARFHVQQEDLERCAHSTGSIGCESRCISVSSHSGVQAFSMNFPTLTPAHTNTTTVSPVNCCVVHDSRILLQFHASECLSGRLPHSSSANGRSLLKLPTDE